MWHLPAPNLTCSSSPNRSVRWQAPHPNIKLEHREHSVYSSSLRLVILAGGHRVQEVSFCLITIFIEPMGMRWHVCPWPHSSEDTSVNSLYVYLLFRGVVILGRHHHFYVPCEPCVFSFHHTVKATQPSNNERETKSSICKNALPNYAHYYD